MNLAFWAKINRVPWLIVVAAVVLFITASLGTSHLGNVKPSPASPTASWRLSSPTTDHQIEGYASEVSMAPGGWEGFHVSCIGASFSAQIYRMGYYGGRGASLVQSRGVLPCHRYQAPLPDKDTGLINCQWPTAFNINVPKSWQPGIYLVKLTTSNGYQSYVPFTLRSPSPQNRFLFIHAVNTDSAYNQWGGDSLYQNTIKTFRQKRAFKVSFNRPFDEFMPFQTQSLQDDGSGNFLAWEYPMIKFLDQYKYNVDYATDVDIDLHPDLLSQYRTVIITGHDEYWSLNMRKAYLNAIKHGVSLAIFGANTGYRPIRYESDAVTKSPDHIVVAYKDTRKDPIKSIQGDIIPTGLNWIGTIKGARESQITGLLWGSETGESGATSADLVVHDDKSWIFKDSGLKNGDRIKGLVGYEYDSYGPSESRPAPVDLVFQTNLVNSLGKEQMADSGLYVYPYGGQVFDAGTIQWAWGLDPSNPLYSAKLVTVTRNILNRFDLNTVY